MAKKYFKCPECGHEFKAEVDFLQDSTKTGLTGMGTGALIGFITGGPAGAFAGAALGAKWGKRTPQLMNYIRCPKCGHCMDT